MFVCHHILQLRRNIIPEQYIYTVYLYCIFKSPHPYSGASSHVTPLFFYFCIKIPKVSRTGRVSTVMPFYRRVGIGKEERELSTVKNLTISDICSRSCKPKTFVTFQGMCKFLVKTLQRLYLQCLNEELKDFEKTRLIQSKKRLFLKKKIGL